MLGKRILTGTLFSCLLIIVMTTTGCSTKKTTTSTVSDTTENVKNQETTVSEETVITDETVNKIEGNNINATLSCKGNSEISLLQLAEKKHDTEDFKTRVSREKGLKIQFTSESKNMEIVFKLIGIETAMIKKGTYGCKSLNNSQYLDVSLSAKSLGQHNFGETFEGTLEILDYGMSSDIICGTFSVIDRKGNKIEGTFSETIRTF